MFKKLQTQAKEWWLRQIIPEEKQHHVKQFQCGARTVTVSLYPAGEEYRNRGVTHIIEQKTEYHGERGAMAFFKNWANANRLYTTYSNDTAMVFFNNIARNAREELKQQLHATKEG